MKGTSNKGDGIYGTSKSGTGVKGVGGAMGVEGSSTGASPGVTGYGAIGVSGDSSNLVSGVGVSGRGFIGMQAISASSGCNGPLCSTALVANGGFDGVVAFGNDTGVYAQGGNYGMTAAGAFAGVSGQNQSGTAGTAVLAQGNTATGFLFRGNNEHNIDVFKVDDSGNGYFRGQVSAKKFVTHAAASVQQATSTGPKVTTFASQVTQANVEHIGESDLVGGAATVHFDPSFAATLARGNYMVFLTPQGPVQGSLYVTQKGPGGFLVRESQGGRSTVVFDYRVVGRPYSTQLNAERDTLQGTMPAGPIHGPAMQTRPKFPDLKKLH